ncbi:hypothetical protein OHD16_21520 [Sphingobacterium sp. ML3W]|uniref:hypothetical protein n=1 Tax=Sphingobacterium sp. ML3W TaxID=1538644 RepID=UPI00249AA0D0|nr:hypothetical protein [Sphingobacterium sp. ML3W]WFA77312.1 hypothetical protein OGI71_14660 [Sphingobacterium sp. ML3W]
MKDEYVKLLDLFKLKEENDRYGRTWMQSPFTFYDKTVATNSYSLVMIPEKSDYQDRGDLVTVLAYYSENLWIDIPLSWLNEAMKKIPMESPLCEACKGDKDVKFNFQYQNKVFEHKNECPICEGSGLKDKYQRTYHSKVFSEYVGVKIGHHIFSGDCLILLIEAAKILNSNTVTMVSQTKKYDKTVFRINEVEVFCMPIHSFEDEISYCDDLGKYLLNDLEEGK